MPRHVPIRFIWLRNVAGADLRACSVKSNAAIDAIAGEYDLAI